MRTVRAQKLRRERLGQPEPKRIKPRIRALLREQARRATATVLWTKERKAEQGHTREANNERIRDTRDKTNWAHGKMQRAGVYATRKRT